jgi:hypothetical protein
MQPEYPNRRREIRFMVEAGATVEIGRTRSTLHAKTVNMSGSGVLLQFEDPVELEVGDEVICEFQAFHDDDKPLPYWGVGDVVRVDGHTAGIDLKAGGFVPLETQVKDSANPDDKTRRASSANAR